MGPMASESKRRIRPPAVAGLFYPDDPAVLRRDVAAYLAEGRRTEPSSAPRALIAPHAGYIYSGPVAASALACWASRQRDKPCVVLFGPSHRVWFQGLALPAADAFRTPLGDVPVDAARLDTIGALPGVQVSADAHRQEHSLEVHLPFLQVLFGELSLLPLVVGEADPAQVATVLEALWDDGGTLFLISSDLSHYHPYAEAVQLDRDTSARIQRLDWQHIDGERACGCRAINGLLKFAESRGLRLTTLDLRNSGDTAGDLSAVVGYGAFALT